MSNWSRFKWVVSVGSLDEIVLVKNFTAYCRVNDIAHRMPLPAETLDDYTDYMFKVMEDYTPEGKYFGTPNDLTMDVFGFFPLPDKRRR